MLACLFNQYFKGPSFYHFKEPGTFCTWRGASHVEARRRGQAYLASSAAQTGTASPCTQAAWHHTSGPVVRGACRAAAAPTVVQLQHQLRPPPLLPPLPPGSHDAATEALGVIGVPLLGAASVTDSAAVPCIARDSSCLSSLAAVATRPREERGERRV
jgi:hypothetical protein